MKIFVVGSHRPNQNADSSKALFIQACTEIGKELRKRKHTLYVGSDSESTADRYIVQGFSGGGAKRNVYVVRPSADITTITDNPEPYSNESDYKGIEFQRLRPDGTYRTAHITGIVLSDATLAIGGSDRGTLPVIYAAAALRKPVAVVTSFGGAAKVAIRDFKILYDDAELASFETAGIYDEKWAAKVIDAIEALQKRNPFDSESKKHLILKAISIVICFGLWILWHSCGSQISSSPLTWIEAIIAILAATGVGVLLRSLAPSIVPKLGPSPNLLQLWGFSIGTVFVAFLVSLLGTHLIGETHNGDQIDPSSIGMNFSVVGLLTALLPEKVWQRVFKFFEKLMET